MRLVVGVGKKTVVVRKAATWEAPDIKAKTKKKKKKKKKRRRRKKRKKKKRKRAGFQSKSHTSTDALSWKME